MRPQDIPQALLRQLIVPKHRWDRVCAEPKLRITPSGHWRLQRNWNGCWTGTV